MVDSLRTCRKKENMRKEEATLLLLLAHLKVWLVPAPSTEMELLSMSKPVTMEEAFMKTFAISSEEGLNVGLKARSRSLMTDPFLHKQRRNFQLKMSEW